MSEVLSRAQPYIQLEEATFFNHSAKPDNGGGKLNSLHKGLHPCLRSEPGIACLQETNTPASSPSPLRTFRAEQHFTLLSLPMNEVYNAIKNQSWVRRLKPIRHDPTIPGAVVPSTIERDRDCLLQKPLMVPERTCPSRLLQRVHSCPRSGLRIWTTQRPTGCPTTTPNHSVPSN